MAESGLSERLRRKAKWNMDSPEGRALLRLAADRLEQLLAEVERVQAALDGARKVLLFADGLCVSETGMPLADLYGEDCEWAQTALRDAGCWPRGTFERTPGNTEIGHPSQGSSKRSSEVSS